MTDAEILSTSDATLAGGTPTTWNWTTYKNQSVPETLGCRGAGTSEAMLGTIIEATMWSGTLPHTGAVTLQPAQHTVQLDVKSPDVKVDNHVDVQPAAVQMDAPVVEAHVHVPQQPAPSVVVETAPAPAVVDMRIVSMPDRETTSRIERDTVTERITRSVQIEKDAS